MFKVFRRFVNIRDDITLPTHKPPPSPYSHGAKNVLTHRRKNAEKRQKTVILHFQQ